MDPTISIISMKSAVLFFAGAFVLVLVLRAINKKLHVFSKGTVSFILAVLIIFTTVDAIQILNGIKISEKDSRSLAASQTIGSIVYTWLNQGAEMAAHQVSRQEDRGYVLEQLKNIEASVVTELEDKNAAAGTLADLQLVSLNVDRYGYPRNPWTNDKSYGFTALLDDGEKFHEFTGDVSVDSHSSSKISITTIKGELHRTVSKESGVAAAAYRNANAYKSDAYFVGGRGLNLVKKD